MKKNTQTLDDRLTYILSEYNAQYVDGCAEELKKAIKQSLLANMPEKKTSIFTHGALGIDDSESINKQKYYNAGHNHALDDCIKVIEEMLR